MTFIKKYWPSVLPILTLVGAALTPAISAFISAHPTVMLILSSAYAVLSHIMPSPVSSTTTIVK